MKIKSDEGLNPALRKEVQGLRQAILREADKEVVNDRFIFVPSTDRPGIEIIDQETGKCIFCPLFAFRTVKEVLKSLFAA